MATQTLDDAIEEFLKQTPLEEQEIKLVKNFGYWMNARYSAKVKALPKTKTKFTIPNQPKI